MRHFQARQRLEVLLLAHPDDRSRVPELAPDDIRAKRLCERPITQARYRDPARADTASRPSPASVAEPSVSHTSVSGTAGVLGNPKPADPTAMAST
jgi:hypothetical protein